MNQDNTIHDILSQKEDFLVIGLTGRMGSGCSKVAEMLATSFEQLKFPHPNPQPGLASLTTEERTIRIIAEFAEAHWLKFEVIQVGAVIATFILDDDERFFIDLSGGVSAERDDNRKAFRTKLLEKLCRKTIDLCLKFGLLDEEKKETYIKEITDEQEKKVLLEQNYVPISADCFVHITEADIQTNIGIILSKLGSKLISIVPEDKKIIDYFNDNGTDSLKYIISNMTEYDVGGVWVNIGQKMSYLYRQVLQKYPNTHRRKYLECVDELVELFSAFYLVGMINSFLKTGESAAETLWHRLEAINRCVEPNAHADNTIIQIEKFVFVKHITTWFGRTVREYVTEVLGEDAYSRLFQRYGQMIRYFSCIPKYNEASKTNKVAKTDQDAAGKKKDIFAIPRKINQHIKVLRHPFLGWDHRPVRIVVDSVKNVFEAVYLRYRYSAFYLWAITTDCVIRERRLQDKHLTDIQVHKLDWNEYPDKGGEVITEVDRVAKEIERNCPDTGIVRKYNEIMKRFYEDEAKADFYLDRLKNWETIKVGREEYFQEYEAFNSIRREFFTNNTFAFYTQDVNSCVCNADVYLFNNVKDNTDTKNKRALLEAVVRNVSLVMYPCLVRPTPIERCMQIALGAKVNSGCLSRQVGAVVTDSQYNILAIGWNDVPCGEVPCAYKNFMDISISADADAYSEYELHDPNFRKRLSKYNIPKDGIRGLSFSYCFKNVHKEIKDPMRSRAMHAEEKALALCGREAEGGYLFTTSSPCEMCSKNAKNHKIRKIYYLEAYPGISQTQYTNSGAKDNRAELILFSGAVGRAYMQMYTPLLPHKDVLEYLGARKIE